MQDLVSRAGGMEGEPFLTTVGSPAGDDCLERSKSVNMMCPVWCSKISRGGSEKKEQCADVSQQ